MLISVIAAAALASAMASPMIDKPSWDQTPTGKSMLRFYPERAQRMGQTGDATVHCQVTEQGTVADCQIVSEKPEGWGFGQAALGLTPLFKMKTKTADGRPVGGSAVNIPIRFQFAAESFEPSQAAIEGARISMQCYGAFASAANAEPTSGPLTQAAGFFADAVIMEAKLLNEPPSEWEARLLRGRLEAPTDGSALAALRERCTRVFPEALKSPTRP